MDMFIDNRLTCMHYHSDGRRQDGRTDVRTDERTGGKKTFKLIVTNNITQIYVYRRTHRPTDTYTYNIRTGRQTDRNIHKTV